MLILVRAQESRDGSVRIGDHPNLGAVSGPIAAEDSEAIVNRKFILPFVFFTELAPISSLMSGEKLKRILIRLLQRS